VTRQDAISYVQKVLAEAHIPDAWREARYLIERALKLSKGACLLDGTVKLTELETKTIEEWAKRRSQHEPLSRIEGSREFWGLHFELNAHTLDPRPDSETLIEAVLKAFPNPTQNLHILDLGTGSGCLLISLLKEYPKAKGIGVDLSFEAATMARKNAQHNGVLDRALFIQGSWGDAIGEEFDVVVSNPPYIPSSQTLEKNVLNHDPHLALFGGNDGLTCYRDLATVLPRLGHTCFLEIGKDQEDDVSDLMKKAGFKTVNQHHDISGIIRVLEFENDSFTCTH